MSNGIQSGMRVASLLGLAFLSGCSTVQHDCPLGETCVGSQDAYEAALEGGGTQESVFNQEEVSPGGVKKEGEQSSSEAQDQQQAATAAEWRPAGARALYDAPVYEPPQPVRVWIAPWRDNDGHLRSGQYIYAVRDGGWNMGEMRSPGEGARILTPSAFVPETEDGEGGEAAVQPNGQRTNSGRVQPRETFEPDFNPQEEGLGPESSNGGNE